VFYGVATCNGGCDASMAVVDAADEDGNTMTGVFYGVACPSCEAGSETGVPEEAGAPQDAAPDTASEAAPDAGQGD
jgi:hypothetical protein